MVVLEFIPYCDPFSNPATGGWGVESEAAAVRPEVAGLLSCSFVAAVGSWSLSAIMSWCHWTFPPDLQLQCFKDMSVICGGNEELPGAGLRWGLVRPRCVLTV